MQQIIVIIIQGIEQKRTINNSNICEIITIVNLSLLTDNITKLLSTNEWNIMR